MKVGLGTYDNGKTLGLWIELRGIEGRIWFRCNTQSGDATVRTLLERAIESGLEEHVERIKRAAYNRGRRSVRKPSEKVTMFATCFNVPDYVGS